MEIEILPGLKAALYDSTFTAEIISSPDSAGMICIPQSVEHNNKKYMIVKIGENAFQGNKVLSSLSFSEDSAVTNIDGKAFDGSSISQLSLPPKLDILDDGWCVCTDNLNQIEIPRNNNEFQWINNEFLIGSSLHTNKLFCNFNNGNCFIGNFLYGRNGLSNKRNVLFFASRNIKEAKIPTDITIINDYAFQNCKKLEFLKFSDLNLEVIQREAFSGCINLKNDIVFPHSLHKLSYGSFKDNKSLTNLTFHSDQIIFDTYCFDGCINLQTVKLTHATKITIKNLAFDTDSLPLDFKIYVRVDATIEGEEYVMGYITKIDFSKPTLKKACPSKSQPYVRRNLFTGSTNLLSLNPRLTKKDKYIKFLQDILISKKISFPNFEEFNDETEISNYTIDRNGEKKSDIIVNQSDQLQSFDQKQNQILNIQDNSLESENPLILTDDARKKKDGCEKQETQAEGIHKEPNQKTECQKIEIHQEKDQEEKIYDTNATTENKKDHEGKTYDTNAAAENKKNQEGKICDTNATENNIKTNSIINCIISNDEEKNYKPVMKISQTDTYVIWQVSDIRKQQNLSKLILHPNETQIENGVPHKMCKEFEVLYKINHPCICKAYLIDTLDTQCSSDSDKNSNETKEPTYSFYFENMSQHLRFILDDNLKLSNTVKSQIAIEILCGMIYLLKLEVNHDSLTIDNILLNENFESKIMLFSIFDRNVSDDDFYNKFENFDFNHSTFSYAYSYGVILHELFLGYQFNEKQNQIEFDLKPSESVSQICLDIIKKCLSPNLSLRPNLEFLLQFIREHSFRLAEGVDFKSVNKRYDEIMKFEESNPPKTIKCLFE